MNLRVKPTILPLMTLGAGAVGLALRAVQFQFGIDEKGLLTLYHPAGLLTLAVTVALLAFITYSVWPMSGVLRYQRLFPSAPLAAIGTLVGAAGVVESGARVTFSLAAAENGAGFAVMSMDWFSPVLLGVGVLTALAMVYLAVCRWQGSHASPWAWAAVCLFFLFHLVGCSRRWSNATQLDVYLYPLLASSFLLLATYYRAAMAGNAAGCRGYLLFSLGAAYCSALALIGCDDPLFYGAMLVWMAADQCSFRPRRGRAQA